MSLVRNWWPLHGVKSEFTAKDAKGAKEDKIKRGFTAEARRRGENQSQWGIRIWFVFGLYQGMALAVPKSSKMDWALAPALCSSEMDFDVDRNWNKALRHWGRD